MPENANDTRVRHCAEAENDDPIEDRVVAIASRASRACRTGGRDDNGTPIGQDAVEAWAWSIGNGTRTY